jgi:2-methylaconitate cis-trans-isomerase PrpF
MLLSSAVLQDVCFQGVHRFDCGFPSGRERAFLLWCSQTRGAKNVVKTFAPRRSFIMHPEMEMIRCAILRGGTSKGVYILKNELPKDPAKRDAVILAIYGSPDVRQIDGLGGADVLTSKLAIVSPSTRPDADIDYTFGQVSFEKALVDYRGNCGNISAGVGSFAIDEGLVTPVEPITTVRIHMTNSDKILVSEVPVKNGKAMVDGDFAIDGVPGTGAKVTLDWSDVVGGITGKLLPTGNVRDTIEVDGVKYTVSIVDGANPVVFVRASELKMRGTESPSEIESNNSLMETIEKVRGRATVMCGMVDKPADARTKSPYIPFLNIISPPADYQAINGKTVKAADIDLVCRAVFMQRVHKAIQVTGSLSTGAFARVPGSLASEVVREATKTRPQIRIGHPSGILPLEAEAETVNGNVKITRLRVFRTARRIMEGYVYVRKSVFAGTAGNEGDADRGQHHGYLAIDSHIVP